MSQSVLSPATIEYPDSDGRPMAESEAQRAAIMYAIGALDVWFEPRADVYVSGDLLLYYEEGNPKASVAPDVFVVFGAAKHLRRTYKLWEEPKVPDFVLEVASASTWEEDEGRKGRLYERLGVREYWQYDATGEHLPVRLKGRRLVGGRYRPHPAIESLNGTLILRSETLGLELRAKGEELYFLDPVTGHRLLGHREEAMARRTAEARVAELEALLRERHAPPVNPRTDRS